MNNNGFYKVYGGRAGTGRNSVREGGREDGGGYRIPMSAAAVAPAHAMRARPTAGFLSTETPDLMVVVGVVARTRTSRVRVQDIPKLD